MAIVANKVYKVRRYEIKGPILDMGCMPGSDVKALLRGYSFDPEYDLWFSPKANVAYSVEGGWNT